MEVVWKPINGFEGSYEVSSEGYVKSLARYVAHPAGGKTLLKERIKSFSKTKFGYMSVHLYTKRIGYSFSIHRLVANAFIPNPENKPQVNHKDGDKSNNCVENLEWATALENNIHAIKFLGKNIRGEFNGHAKLTANQVVEIKLRRYYQNTTYSVLAKEYNVSLSAINSILHKRTWSYTI